MTDPIAILHSRIRIEERRLLEEFDRRRVPYELLDTRKVTFRPDGLRLPYRGALSREISHTRNVYATRLLEHAGLTVVNSHAILTTCGDKLLTTLQLLRAGIPTPRTLIGLTPESVADQLDDFGYPSVVKPLTGSWGRLGARLKERETAEALLEHRAALTGPQHQITYVQEYIDKPGRDIRAYVFGGEVVGAIYKYSDHWQTNTARGGDPAVCPVTPDLEKLLVATADAIGEGVLAVDLLEGPDGELYVNEVNHTPEFHGAIAELGTGMVGRYVDYVLRRVDDAHGDAH
ncbi:lysine biosynthesis protein LysX [Streptomyces triticagri]|uniref:Lysine biosynthesis protein LysX n=1 Tax=Streptomyces triticagri TaxID=2293568 RepID=A0A372M2R5_9ACTN|nr:lysine biosynthesis protein LysX [Streptomyces triticagri]RFU85224.1 lysine biosynthesis protein LysX [Streptomyces triticagri]